MFVKLASRNVRRQIGHYLIYFITVSLTVALMFAINNVIFSEPLLARAETIGELKSGLIGITVFVSLIVAFVLGYATSYMLRLRKREFGTYLTLGMTRQNIVSIFLLETLLLCFAALGTGMLLGLFFYQGLMAVITHLMELNMVFASYSLQGFLLTIGMVATVFLLSSATSALYLKKVSIYDLIHGDKKVEKAVRHPIFWLIVTFLSLAAVIGSCIAFSHHVEQVLHNGGDTAGGLLLPLLILAVALVLFHIGLARSVVHLLLKNKVICSHGTNTFTLRQLSGRLGANSAMAGILAFLIAFAVIGANVSFVQKVSEQASLEKQYPFDIQVTLDPHESPAIPPEQAESIIGRYAPIETKIPYATYSSGTGYLHSFTKWTGEGYEGLTDSLIRESDLNRLLAVMGRDPIVLDGSFKILANFPQVMGFNFSDAVLKLGRQSYSFGGILSDLPRFSFVYFLAVVPDEAVTDLPEETSCIAYDLNGARFDAQALRAELSYTYTPENASYTTERCDYQIKEYGRARMNGQNAIFVIGALYIAIVFVCMAMAVLALKTLSGLAEDRQRYGILFRIGADTKEQSRSLFRQIFCFFFLPFAMPLLLSIPTGLICAQIMRIGGFPAQTPEVYGIAAAIAAVLAVIYLLYFTATYLVSKKTVVQTRP